VNDSISVNDLKDKRNNENEFLDLESRLEQLENQNIESNEKFKKLLDEKTKNEE